MPGLFVTFEGIDRSGKTTQARMLVEALGDDAVAVREPGGTELGERVRAVLKDPAVEIDARSEALLFAAARAELVAQVIKPALAAGKVVVSDRFLDSSLAYQGAARGLGVEEVAAMNALAVDEVKPDLTIYLAIEPGVASRREGEGDRIEDEGEELQQRVAEAYDRLATEDAARWRRIAAHRPVVAVHADVMEAVEAARTGAPA
jgi:dTMP kinase